MKTNVRRLLNKWNMDESVNVKIALDALDAIGEIAGQTFQEIEAMGGNPNIEVKNAVRDIEAKLNTLKQMLKGR